MNAKRGLVGDEKHRAVIPRFKSPGGYGAEEAMSSLLARKATAMMNNNSNRIDVYGTVTKVQGRSPCHALPRPKPNTRCIAGCLPVNPKSDGLGGKTARAAGASNAVTDIAYDHTRNIALVSCLNRTVRVFNLARHTVQGNMALSEIRKRISVGEGLRAKSKVCRARQIRPTPSELHAACHCMRTCVTRVLYHVCHAALLVQDEWENILSHVADIEGTKIDSEHMAMKMDYGPGISVDRHSGLPVLQSVATIGTGPGTPMCMSVRAARG